MNMRQIWLLLALVLTVTKVNGSNVDYETRLFGDETNNKTSTYRDAVRWQESLSRLPTVVDLLAEITLLASVLDVAFEDSIPGEYKFMNEKTFGAAVYTASGMAVKTIETSGYKCEEVSSIMESFQLDLLKIARLVNESKFETANKTINSLERKILKSSTLSKAITEDVKILNRYVAELAIATIGIKGAIQDKETNTHKQLDIHNSKLSLLEAKMLSLNEETIYLNNELTRYTDVFINLCKEFETNGSGSAADCGANLPVEPLVEIENVTSQGKIALDKVL